MKDTKYVVISLVQESLEVTQGGDCRYSFDTNPSDLMFYSARNFDELVGWLAWRIGECSDQKMVNFVVEDWADVTNLSLNNHDLFDYTYRSIYTPSNEPDVLSETYPEDLLKEEQSIQFMKKLRLAVKEKLGANPIEKAP